jgi:hypothetical protein
MCSHCEGFVSISETDVVCSSETSPTADNAEGANLQPPTNAAQNAQSSASGDPAAAGA